MQRRDFLRKGTAAAAGLAASEKLLPLAKASEGAQSSPIPQRRLAKTGAARCCKGLPSNRMSTLSMK